MLLSSSVPLLPPDWITVTLFYQDAKKVSQNSAPHSELHSTCSKTKRREATVEDSSVNQEDAAQTIMQKVVLKENVTTML